MSYTENGFLKASNGALVVSGAGSVGGGISTSATFSELPADGNTDGDVRLVLSEYALYAWNANTSTWVAIAGGGSGGPGGGGDGDDLDVPIVASDLAGLGVGDQVGREGIIRIGAYPDDYSEEFVWDGTRWIGIREIEVSSQNDTWGMDLSDVAPADMTTFRRVTSALPYGKAHTFITDDVTVGDATVPVNNGAQFTVDPFKCRNYTITPTGFSSSQFTGCTWARTNGTANGTETFPTTVTPVVQERQLGGFGTFAIPVDRVGEMYAAGFQLEERASAFMNGSKDGKAIQLTVYWNNFDEGEDFDVPEAVPSGGLGNGVILTGPSNDLGASSREAERSFQMVTVGFTPFTASTPTKRYLVPTVVARMSSGATDNGEFYNYCHKVRWVSS